ncbi:MAG: hypothetical protein QOH63_1484 [Acidobacteriota bacterium]|jgi:hypothetical protein|nr:hypothetical protein [Acidobacteriota bacterium]
MYTTSPFWKDCIEQGRPLSKPMGSQSQGLFIFERRDGFHQ